VVRATREHGKKGKKEKHRFDKYLVIEVPPPIPGI